MTEVLHIRARITPWDDGEFVRAFERARDEMEASGCCADGPPAGARVQRLLREAGYPRARVEVVRSVEEALAHTSHWLVSRDG